MRLITVLVLVGVLAGCANFRAAGTFEYSGDNMRPDCAAAK